jgi:hypothetical protein
MFRPTFRVAGLALLCAFAACSSGVAPTSGPITGNSFAIQHVRAFDGREIILDAVVVVRDGLIEAVASHYNIRHLSIE